MTTPGIPESDENTSFLQRWHRAAIVLLAVSVAAGAFLVWKYWEDLFGPGTWGSGGNMVAWVICGAISFSWLAAKEKARHLAKMAQSARHHEEVMTQVALNHEDMKMHVTAEVAAQAGQQPTPPATPQE
jgi:hypothetical protein